MHMMLLRILTTLMVWTEVLDYVRGQSPCLEPGWFGEKCVYRCRCQDVLECDEVTGECSDTPCLPGWFGPSCQHVDLAYGQPAITANGTALPRNVTDNDDSTCAVTDFLEVTLNRKYLISWVRLIFSDSAAWSQVRVLLSDKGSNTIQECTGQGSAVVLWKGGGFVDIHCNNGVFADTVRIEIKNDTSTVCSLNVDGGRNVVIRGATSQIGTKSPYTADLSVDGNTDQSFFSVSCSRTSDNAFSFGCDLTDMTADPWWQVVTPGKVRVTRFVVYPREGSKERLQRVKVFASNGNPKYDLVYEQPTGVAIRDTLRVDLKTPITLDRVALQTPGQCQILEFCEMEVYGERLCPSGRYGLECEKDCGCRNVTETCQPITGGCVTGCPDGYTGLACDQKCNGTRYGKECSETCSAGCREGTCDHVTGNCTLGCKDGWYNESRCDRACDPGFYGKDCINPCPVNCPLACNSIGFCDQCTPGYEGFKCEDVCTAGTFGMGCKDTCSYHCETLECHHITGACSCKSGFKLDQCIESCDMTTWGQNCTQTCSTGCNQQDCDAITGVCQHGCGPGFLGEFCDLACGPGKFGRDCAEVCSAKCADSVCNHVNGDCISCPPGFQGKACDTSCGAGRWGTQCSKSCSENCGGDDMACSPTDGVCSTGCVDGWRGPLCTQECLPGNFGSNCTLNCSQNCLPPAAGNSPCHHVTGQCPQGCNAGFAGAACLTQAAPSAAMLGGVLAGVAVAIIVIVIVIAFVVFRRRKRSPKSLIDDTTEENGNVRLSSAFVNINPGFVGNGKDNGFDDEDEASDLGISMATESEVERDKPVQQNGTPDTTNTRFASRELATKLEGWRSDWGELYEQFTELPKGLIHTTSVALNLSNKRKNRYKNICAYDDSRVKLNIMDSDPNSDYINASYVDGYDGKPKFIASQGAHDVMVNDFLRMLWEKRVTTVVMLTNTHEGGKHKCEQYWPDSGEKKYGTVVVTLLSTIYTADYVIRTLQVAKEGRKIQVSQFHFTSWPDKGVPFSPWPLVDFHMMVKTHTATQPHDTPIVVHCSAGIGRTGTYIALDKLLCESAATQSLDFNTCVWNLRQARVNMIQTLEQYYFLHEAVLVGQAVAGSLHKKDTLADHVLDLGRPTAEGYSKMAAEYKRLGACRCRYDEDDYQAGRQEENISKNRDYNILPRDSHRPILTSTVAGTNDYINAVFLPGYRKRQHFLVTQMPLASTVLDLWRLVGEHTVSTIVTFPSNPTTVGDSAPEFLPEEGQTCQFGPYKVTGRSYTSQNRYREGFLYMVKSRRLSLGRHGRGLHVLRCEESNPDPDLMLSLAQAAIFGVPEKQLEDSIILVVCRTGAEMSGVFAAVAQLIHRLGESPVSVPTVVGNLRAIRPQLISSLEQYNTIYEAVKQFAINSSIYTNLAITMPSKPPRKDRGSSKNKKKENNADQQTERRNSKKDKKAEKDKTKVNGRANGSANGEMVEQPEDDDKDGNRDGGNNQLPKASSNENDAVTVGGTNTVNFSL